MQTAPAGGNTLAYGNDGQHRDSGRAENNGQRSTHSPGAVVGQRSGGEMNMSVPGSDRGSDIETTRGPGAGAGFPPNAATHPDSDDVHGTGGGGA